MDEQQEKAFNEEEQGQSAANTGNEDATNLQDDTVNMAEDAVETDNMSDEKKHDEPTPEEKYASLNDSYLRLIAEFDNFRKRTIREKADLIKSGGANVLTNLLPVIDDLERALSTLQAAGDTPPPVVEGMKLIYDKFIGFLLQQGVKIIDAVGQPFDTEWFEAIATIPAPEEEMKGKVIDCVQTGYKLYDRVLRHAKVVVGE
ncbi:MAG: nucleotide exchange factor GrpE [Tannerella sp.]|jgi:molecular chaperone GrpE|nr:nucleotide exchange factor GrpE [Tannerella sp.]